MQGFNMGRYMPPASLDPSLSSDKVGGFNSQKGHPLGSRFSKVKSSGITKIRFEVPFDTWCETCKPEFLIKQGNRFNAEKKEVGRYLTSPIWEFSFHHPPCGGVVAIRTDPENTCYIVAAGGRKKAGAITTTLDREYGEQIVTEEQREQREKNPFAKLEGDTEEKERASVFASRVKELKKYSDRRMEYDYDSNSRAKKHAREERRKREVLEKEKGVMKARYSLAFDLLDHNQADADRAAETQFRALPVKDLKQQITDGMRAKDDPWESAGSIVPNRRGGRRSPKIKPVAPIKARKRVALDEAEAEAEEKVMKAPRLVAYASDDDDDDN